MNKTTGINDGTLTLSQEGSDKEEMKGSPEEKPYDRVIDRSSDKEELEIITDKVDIKDSDKEDNSSYKYDIEEENSGDIPSGGKDNDNYSWKDYYVPPKHEEKGGIGESESNVFSNIIKALMIGATLFAAVAAGIFIALLDYEKKGVDLKNALAGTYRIELSEILLKELRAENDDTGLEVIKEEMTGKEDKEEDEEKEEEEKEEDKEEKEEDGSAEEEAQDENPGGMEIASLGTIVNASDNDVISVGSEEKESEPEEIKDVNEGYPLEFREVDYGYFLDALFVGDSRLQGFGMYADLPATYYCVTSFSVYKYDTMKVVQTDAGKVPIFDAIPLDMFTKIYIKVGLNELGGDEDLFFEKYGELIDRLRICEPRAIIYVHGVLPVTAAKSASDKYHNNIRISERNEKLKAFAEEKKAYYIEPSPELLLEDGSLIPESAFDGIHLKAQYMGPWKEYLRKHAIVP